MGAPRGPAFGLQLIMDAWKEGGDFGAGPVSAATEAEFKELFELYLGRNPYGGHGFSEGTHYIQNHAEATDAPLITTALRAVDGDVVDDGAVSAARQCLYACEVPEAPELVAQLGVMALEGDRPLRVRVACACALGRPAASEGGASAPAPGAHAAS